MPNFDRKKAVTGEERSQPGRSGRTMVPNDRSLSLWKKTWVLQCNFFNPRPSALCQYPLPLQSTTPSLQTPCHSWNPSLAPRRKSPQGRCACNLVGLEVKMSMLSLWWCFSIIWGWLLWWWKQFSGGDMLILVVDSGTLFRCGWGCIYNVILVLFIFSGIEWLEIWIMVLLLLFSQKSRTLSPMQTHFLSLLSPHYHSNAQSCCCTYSFLEHPRW